MDNFSMELKRSAVSRLLIGPRKKLDSNFMEDSEWNSVFCALFQPRVLLEKLRQQDIDRINDELKRKRNALSRGWFNIKRVPNKKKRIYKRRTKVAEVRQTVDKEVYWRRLQRLHEEVNFSHQVPKYTVKCMKIKKKKQCHRLESEKINSVAEAMPIMIEKLAQLNLFVTANSSLSAQTSDDKDNNCGINNYCNDMNIKPSNDTQRATVADMTDCSNLANVDKTMINSDTWYSSTLSVVAAAESVLSVGAEKTNFSSHGGKFLLPITACQSPSSEKIAVVDSESCVNVNQVADNYWNPSMLSIAHKYPQRAHVDGVQNNFFVGTNDATINSDNWRSSSLKIAYRCLNSEKTTDIEIGSSADVNKTVINSDIWRSSSPTIAHESDTLAGLKSGSSRDVDKTVSDSDISSSSLPTLAYQCPNSDKITYVEIESFAGVDKTVINSDSLRSSTLTVSYDSDNIANARSGSPVKVNKLVNDSDIWSSSLPTVTFRCLNSDNVDVEIGSFTGTDKPAINSNNSTTPAIACTYYDSDIIHGVNSGSSADIGKLTTDSNIWSLSQPTTGCQYLSNNSAIGKESRSAGTNKPVISCDDLRSPFSVKEYRCADRAIAVHVMPKILTDINKVASNSNNSRLCLPTKTSRRPASDNFVRVKSRYRSSAVVDKAASVNKKKAVNFDRWRSVLPTLSYRRSDGDGEAVINRKSVGVGKKAIKSDRWRSELPTLSYRRSNGDGVAVINKKSVGVGKKAIKSDRWRSELPTLSYRRSDGERVAVINRKSVGASKKAIKSDRWRSELPTLSYRRSDGDDIAVINKKSVGVGKKAIKSDRWRSELPTLSYRRSDGDDIAEINRKSVGVGKKAIKSDRWRSELPTLSYRRSDEDGVAEINSKSVGAGKIAINSDDWRSSFPTIAYRCPDRNRDARVKSKSSADELKTDINSDNWRSALPTIEYRCPASVARVKGRYRSPVVDKSACEDEIVINSDDWRSSFPTIAYRKPDSDSVAHVKSKSSTDEDKTDIYSGNWRSCLTTIAHRCPDSNGLVDVGCGSSVDIDKTAINFNYRRSSKPKNAYTCLDSASYRLPAKTDTCNKDALLGTKNILLNTRKMKIKKQRKSVVECNDVRIGEPNVVATRIITEIPAVDQLPIVSAVPIVTAINSNKNATAVLDSSLHSKRTNNINLRRKDFRIFVKRDGNLSDSSARVDAQFTCPIKKKRVTPSIQPWRNDIQRVAKLEEHNLLCNVIRVCNCNLANSSRQQRNTSLSVTRKSEAINTSETSKQGNLCIQAAKKRGVVKTTRGAKQRNAFVSTARKNGAAKITRVSADICGSYSNCGSKRMQNVKNNEVRLENQVNDNEMIPINQAVNSALRSRNQLLDLLLRSSSQFTDNKIPSKNQVMRNETRFRKQVMRNETRPRNQIADTKMQSKNQVKNKKMLFRNLTADNRTRSGTQLMENKLPPVKNIWQESPAIYERKTAANFTNAKKIENKKAIVSADEIKKAVVKITELAKAMSTLKSASCVSGGVINNIDVNEVSVDKGGNTRVNNDAVRSNIHDKQDSIQTESNNSKENKVTDNYLNNNCRHNICKRGNIICCQDNIAINNHNEITINENCLSNDHPNNACKNNNISSGNAAALCKLAVNEIEDDLHKKSIENKCAVGEKKNVCDDNTRCNDKNEEQNTANKNVNTARDDEKNDDRENTDGDKNNEINNVIENKNCFENYINKNNKNSKLKSTIRNKNSSKDLNYFQMTPIRITRKAVKNAQEKVRDKHTKVGKCKFNAEEKRKCEVKLVGLVLPVLHKGKLSSTINKLSLSSYRQNDEEVATVETLDRKGKLSTRSSGGIHGDGQLVLLENSLSTQAPLFVKELGTASVVNATTRIVEQSPTVVSFYLNICSLCIYKINSI